VEEAWEWERIQSQACPQCGQNPSTAPRTSLGRIAVQAAEQWQAFLADANDDYVRIKPAPDVWSPMQYGMHVRDMLQVFGDRILVAVAQHNPSVPWFDPGEAEWARYNTLDRAEVAGEIDRSAERLGTILSERKPTDWTRPARRDGVDQFTVAGLACFAVHEAHHHLLDANGQLGGPP
jgi:hypothetical protein